MLFGTSTRRKVDFACVGHSVVCLWAQPILELSCVLKAGTSEVCSPAVECCRVTTMLCCQKEPERVRPPSFQRPCLLDTCAVILPAKTMTEVPRQDRDGNLHNCRGKVKWSHG